MASNPQALPQGQWIPISWITYLSAGAPRLFAGPDGLPVGAPTTRYYQPYGAGYHMDTAGRLTRIPFPGDPSMAMHTCAFNALGDLVPVFGLPPVGLFGHVYAPDTGMVAVHHRHFHPRIGHFLTRDFQTPDVSLPSTYFHPYALQREIQ